MLPAFVCCYAFSLFLDGDFGWTKVDKKSYRSISTYLLNQGETGSDHLAIFVD